MTCGRPCILRSSQIEEFGCWAICAGFLDISLSKLALTTVTFVPRFADWEEHMAKLMSKSELIHMDLRLIDHRSTAQVVPIGEGKFGA